MKKSRFSKEQIVGVLKEAEVGVRTKDPCVGLGLAMPRSTTGRQSMEALEMNEAWKFASARRRNSRLKKIVAQQALELDALKVVLVKKW